MALLASVETPDWSWFETGLAYDNARLSQALIVTGAATGTPAYLDAGLRSLRWLMDIQTAPDGLLPAGGDREFRNCRNSCQSLRPAACRGSRNHLGMHCGLARQQERRMGGRRNARLPLVYR